MLLRLVFTTAVLCLLSQPAVQYAINLSIHSRFDFWLLF